MSPLRFAEELRRALRGSPALEELSSEVLERLEALDRRVVEWSRRMDLTGFRSDEERIRRYFAEALAAVQWLSGKAASAGGRALDVGSGGGSPALPLTILRPQWRWTLVESRRKKSLFLDQVARELGLDGVSVVTERFELVRIDPVDALTVRGVRMTGALFARAAAAIRPGGRILWFSGEERLEKESQGIEEWSLKRLAGPVRLLGEGQAALLALEKQGIAATAGECFT